MEIDAGTPFIDSCAAYRRGRRRQCARILRFPDLRLLCRLYRRSFFSIKYPVGKPVGLARHVRRGLCHAANRQLGDRKNGRSRGTQARDDSHLLADGSSNHRARVDASPFDDRHRCSRSGHFVSNAAGFCSRRRSRSDHGVSFGSGAAREAGFLYRIPGLDSASVRSPFGSCRICACQHSKRTAIAGLRLADCVSDRRRHRALWAIGPPELAQRLSTRIRAVTGRRTRSPARPYFRSCR